MRRILGAVLVISALLGGCASYSDETGQSTQITAAEPAPTLRATAVPSPAYTPRSAPTLTPLWNPSPKARIPDSIVLERQTLSRFNTAVIAWNKAAAPLAADLNDPTLDIEHFGARTAKDRAKMEKSVAAMKAAIDDGADPALISAVTGMIQSYRWKLTAINGILAAVDLADPKALESAYSIWELADGERYRAAPALLEAARPYLMPAEIAEWERAFAGS